jgi:hypothetical protein
MGLLLSGLSISGTVGVSVVSAVAPVDPPYPYSYFTSLYLTGSGVNGSQNNTFIDSSNDALTITRAGNATQGSVSPFSPNGWSNEFNSGTTDYLQLTTGAMGLATPTTPFTAEAWVYVTALTGVCIASSAFGGSGTIPFVFGMNGGNSGDTTTAGLKPWCGHYTANTWNFAAISPTAISINTWVHLAYVYTGSTITIYVNGTSVVSNTKTSWETTAGTAGYYIGRKWDTSTSAYFSGYISNFRFVRGTAVYTTNFTPPTGPLTAITGTAILTAQGPRFKDNSTNNYAVTVTGAPKVANISPFAPTSTYSTDLNGGSMFFDGTGDYVSTPASTSLQLSTSNFTVEAYTYLNATVAGQQLLAGHDGNTGASNWEIRNDAGVLKYYISSTGTSWNVANGVAMAAVSTSLFQWIHIALVRNGSVFTPYVNGVAGTTTTNAAGIYNNSKGVYVGSVPVAGVGTNGYISSVRLVNGTAVYTTTFTPPAAPLTAITNTKLLLNGTNAGIFDATSKADLETIGNAQITTSIKKNGTGSMMFATSSDYLSFPASTKFRHDQGNWTTECWVNLPSVTGYHCIASMGTYLTANNWSLYISNGAVGYEKGTGAWASTASTLTSALITANTWAHIAWVKNGTTYSVYVNGTLAQQTTSSTFGTGKSGNVYIGTYFNNGVPANGFNGYIDDLRISNSALYTSNFTPV